MAARAVAIRTHPEVIDVLGDDSDLDPPARGSRAPLELDANGDLSPLDELPYGFFDEPAEKADPAAPEPAREAPVHGQIINIDGEDVFIPDEVEPEPAAPAGAAQRDPDTPSSPRSEHLGAYVLNGNDHDAAVALNDEDFTADTCLQRVLEIFPDISHEYVHQLYNDFDENGDYEDLSAPARLDNIIEQLLSATSYPKQEKGKQPVRKRKREDSIDDSDTKQWECQDREVVPNFLKGSMQAMLKAEFADIPVVYINETLATHKHFYQAYIMLASVKDGHHPDKRAFGRGRPSRNLANADTIATNCGWPPLTDELNVARKRVQITRTLRAAEDAKKMAEEENLQRAKERGETAECSACFDDLPLNRQIHCDGLVAHFTCFDCAERFIQSEVGESRCRVLCTAGCGAPFPPNQLNLLSDKHLLEKLAELEQEKAIRDAGLEDLEECPFCDYKAIMPPVDEDFEFRCANPECEKISCRRCKSVSHIPISCEQHAKHNKINSRHKIEEAMTAAMIRSCNKCKKQFIKDYGCNKMSCPSCGNLQCYVCSKSLTNYDHFDQAPNRAATGATVKQCPLYDNVEERHEREVKEAEAAARAQVMQENPDVQQDDLEIKVSDAVKKATADRIEKAGGVGGGGGAAYAGFAGLGGHMPRAAVRAMLAYDGANDEDDHARNEDPVRRHAMDRIMARADAIHLAHDQRVELDAAQMAALPRLAARRAAAPPPAPQALQPQGFIPVYGFQPAAQPNANFNLYLPGRDRLRDLVGPVQAPPRPRTAPAPALFDPFAGQQPSDLGIDPLQPPAKNIYNRAGGEMGRDYGAPGAFPLDDEHDMAFPGFSGVRQQRVNFQHLEDLRRRHDEEIRQRARLQQQQARQRLEQVRQRQQVARVRLEQLQRERRDARHR